MLDKIKAVFISVFVCVFCIFFVSAGFNLDSHDLKINYMGGETIKGVLNISFDNERVDSLFTSNFDGNISLMKLLEANKFVEGENFNCNNLGCIEQYSLGANTNKILLDNKKVLGLQVKGNDIKSVDFNFVVESKQGETCSGPLLIDLLADDEYKLGSNNYIDQICALADYGCFDKTLGEYSDVKIGINEEKCEIVTVNAAPAYRAGASVSKVGTKRGELEIIMYKDDDFLDSCILDDPDGVEDCVIEVGSTVKSNFSVCVLNTGIADYVIRTETEGKVCGSGGRDFEIFAKPLKFNQSSINVNRIVFDDGYIDISLEEYVMEYLESMYEVNSDGGVVCNPCVIPIGFNGPPQNLNFIDIGVEFVDGQDTIVGGQYNKIYLVGITEARVSSDEIKLDLGLANFRIPVTSEEDEFKLLLNDETVFKEDIIIEKSFSFDIDQGFVFLGVNTEFSIISEFDIESSRWDFGDGSAPVVVSGGKVNHRYIDSKKYDLEVEVTRKDGKSASKIFKIIAGNPKESANVTIKEYKKNMAIIDSQIEDLSSWIREDVRIIIAYGQLSNRIFELENSFSIAESDEDYTKVMNGLLELDVPSSVFYSVQSIVPISVGYENIYERYVEEISGEEVKNSEELRKNIVGWIEKNYDINIESKVVSTLIDGEKEDLLTEFSFDIVPKKGGEGNLFIDYPFESIDFQQEYGQRSVGEGAGTAILISGSGKIVNFFIKGRIDVRTLGAYISPEIMGFSNIEKKPFCFPGDKDCEPQFPRAKFIIWIGILLVVVLIVYVILQEWYKKHYEGHLFKDKNELYNLINFIYNSRTAGLKDIEISKKLRKVGWKKEKIRYAFKKIDGKRTGMWEIPLFKWSENRKVAKEIEKRQGRPPDIRFIKRPRFRKI
jgi:PKD repeat protein